MEATQTIISQARVSTGAFVAPGTIEWGYRNDVQASILNEPTFLGAFSFPTFSVRIDPGAGAQPPLNWVMQCTVNYWIGCDTNNTLTPTLMNYGSDPRVVGMYELYPIRNDPPGATFPYEVKWVPRQGVCATESKRKTQGGFQPVYFSQFRVIDEQRALRPGTYPAVSVYQASKSVTFWGTNNP